MDVKKNFSLILGISIPILMILLVAGSIYLPGFFVEPPQYNFLYLSGTDYYTLYTVQNDRLTKHETPKNGSTYYPPGSHDAKLYLYDVRAHEAREISFEQAQKLSLDTNPKSFDGYEIVHGSYGGGIFPFFYGSDSDYDTMYLKGHNVSKKLNLQHSGSYYNFRFLGWIK